MEALIVALTALIAAMAGAIPVVIKLWRRDDATDKRLDDLWEAHMRRGAVEATYKKLAMPGGLERVEDIIVRPDVMRAYDPIAPALRRIRRNMKDATPGQFAEQVEKQLGPWIAKHICAVLGVSEYACLAMAAKVADMPENGSDPTECKVNIQHGKD